MKKNPKTLFDALFKSAEQNRTTGKKTKQSLEWYKTKIISLFGSRFIHPSNFFEKKNYPNRPIPGNIVTFKYKPKYEDKLRYYDAFPLVLILKTFPGGFIGLNFHYLKPLHRAHFMDLLYDFGKYYKDTGSLRINITYKMLKGSSVLSYYKPCIKKYLNGHISNIFYTLTPNEWDIALFLPTEQFINENEEKVWKESSDIIGKS